jgi:hypothetical protein
MIEQLPAPDGVIAFRAVGTVVAEDYHRVLRPAVDAAVAEHDRIRIVFELGPEFDGYSAAAAWEDLKLWGPHLTKWERCAVVSDHRLIVDAVKAFRFVMPGEVRVFAAGELEGALAWAAGEAGAGS